MATPSSSTQPQETSHCDACVQGFFIDGTPTGKMEKIAGIEYYIAGEGFAKGGKAILIACDIFGLGVPNPRLLADIISTATSLPVYIPDLLMGDYPSAVGIPFIEKPMKDESWLKRTVATTKMLGAFMTVVGPAFMVRHRPGVLIGIVDKFTEALREEKNITRIGMVGYCLGGSVTTKIAASNTIDVLVTAHPGSLSLSDFEGIHQPFALICAEEDFSFDGLKKAAEGVLEKKKAAGIPIAVYDHPGTTHGFAARPNLNDPEIKLAFEKATQQTIDWFKAHL